MKFHSVCVILSSFTFTCFAMFNMQKKYMLLIAATLIVAISFSQSISPSSSTEFCPLVNYTFTVTLPRIANGTTPFVASWTNSPIVVNNAFNINHTQTQTTFSFVGRFRDENVTQTFRIDYTPNNGTPTFYDASFNKIRSLFFNNSLACPSIQPNPASIKVDPCQIENIRITFNNITWSTFDSPSTFCWGTITTYQYRLPVGWSLNGVTSTGSNWIEGSNDVTVTSDRVNSGQILIRPSTNNCAAGLANGQTPVAIGVSRPKPSLSFTTQNPLCTSATFTANNVPSWVSSVSWQATPSWLVSISDPNANPSTFTKVNDGVADVKFTISGGATCPVSFVYNTQEIVNASKLEVGTPYVSWPEVMHPTGGCLPQGFNVTYTSSSQFRAYYEWGYYEGPSTMLSPYVLVNPAGTNQQPIRILNNYTINRISVRGGNACGLGLQNIREFEFHPNCDGGPDVEYKPNFDNIVPVDIITPLKFAVRGNVVNSVLSLQIPPSGQSQTILISDMNGRIMKRLIANELDMAVDISSFSPGLYMVTLIGSAEKETHRFIKQ